MQSINIAQGIQILSPYYKNPNGYNSSAGHDVFYMHPTDISVSPDDIARLIALGWFQEDAEYDREVGYKAENYRRGEGWTAYV